MKIQPVHQNIIQSYQANKVQPPETVRPKSTADEVSFSREAISFSKTLTQVKDQMEIRAPEETARIAELTARIQRGEYHVDSKKIAEKMISGILGE